MGDPTVAEVAPGKVEGGGTGGEWQKRDDLEYGWSFVMREMENDDEICGIFIGCLYDFCGK